MERPPGAAVDVLVVNEEDDPIRHRSVSPYADAPPTWGITMSAV